MVAGRTSQSKGGKARAAALDADTRSAIASRAAESRWGTLLPRATHVGPLTIGDKTILSAVLENRKRVLTQETFLTAIGRAAKAKGGTGSSILPVDGLPPFLVAENLKPFISEELLRSTTPLVFRMPKGGKAYGYEAELLPMVCEVYLKARDEKKLFPSQQHIAKTCEVLMRGLARVGIIALVDEATGYQQDRARDELNRILEAYIAKELLPWTKRFPDEFFRQIYRLHGWQYKPGHHRHPHYVGKLINQLVYEQLPFGVLPELRRLNPPTEKGYRRWKHSQFLTPETGHPHLDRQIVETCTLMRVSDDKHSFFSLFKKAFPRKGQQMDLDFPIEETVE